jgi:hypothetical protein
MDTIHDIEVRRLILQSQLDSTKTQAERNKQGQFATPPELATQLLEHAWSLMPAQVPVRFLDPAVGTGSFFTALFKVFPPARIMEAVGYEIDSSYAKMASQLWDKDNIKIYNADFTRALPPVSENLKPNLLICNPPYIRHHHLQKVEKQRLRLSVEKALNIRLSEQSGLYCHFLCLADQWLSEDGLAAWLIPGEFLDVNYGKQIREYLRERVTLLHIHRFDPKEVQFSDALVSSTIVCLRKSKPPLDHQVTFTFGGTLKQPRLSHLVPLRELEAKDKWNILSLVNKDNQTRNAHNSLLNISSANLLYREKTGESISGQYKQASFANFFGIPQMQSQPPKTLADLFHVKRGLATGANSYFVLHEEEAMKYAIPAQFLQPILPGPRWLPVDEVTADNKGFPIVENRQYLLVCNLAEAEIQAHHKTLWEYLQTGIKMEVHKGYICSHRNPWYMQEKRPACMFLCAYMGRQDSKRGQPFRFILNHSIATATNAYHMLYPKPYLQQALEARPQLANTLWQALKTISQDLLINEGRVYGGGLHKMEPGELANVPANHLFEILKE